MENKDQGNASLVLTKVANGWIVRLPKVKNNNENRDMFEKALNATAIVFESIVNAKGTGDIDSIKESLSKAAEIFKPDKQGKLLEVDEAIYIFPELELALNFIQSEVNLTASN